MVLNVDGKRRGIPGSCRCTDALGHFLLYHDRDSGKRTAVEQRRDGRAGDIIRQVCTGIDGLPRELLLAQCLEVGLEHVALYHLDVITVRERLPEYREQRTVNLNRRDLLGTLRQLDGQAAHTRTDFHRAAVFVHTALSRDALGYPLLGQEVLSERFGKAKAVTG